MKFKACAIAALLVFGGFLPVFVSYASESNEVDISQLVPHHDQEVRAEKYTEKSKTVTSSLKLSTLQEESRTEKRTTSLAEPRDTLRGLKGVMVFVEDIGLDVENHGLTKNLLKKEVESRLRQADIPVLTADEAFNMPGKPYLYLHLTTHNTGIELYSYSIRIEFNQDVLYDSRAVHQSERNHLDRQRGRHCRSTEFSCGH